MAVSGGFDSASGVSAATGDTLDHALATSRDAVQLTPNLRDDPDAGGQIRSAAHRPAPSLWDDPDAGGRIHSAVHRPTPRPSGTILTPAAESEVPRTGPRPASGTTLTPGAESTAPCTGRRPASGTILMPAVKSTVRCNRLRAASTSFCPLTWPARAINS